MINPTVDHLWPHLQERRITIAAPVAVTSRNESAPWSNSTASPVSVVTTMKGRISEAEYEAAKAAFAAGLLETPESFNELPAVSRRTHEHRRHRRGRQDERRRVCSAGPLADGRARVRITGESSQDRHPPGRLHHEAG